MADGMATGVDYLYTQGTLCINGFLSLPRIFMSTNVQGVKKKGEKFSS